MPRHPLTITLVCRNLPGLRFEDPHPSSKPARKPVYLGIQRGRDMEQFAPADQDGVTFEVPLQVDLDAPAGRGFYGPYAQGKPDERFIYLVWAEMSDGSPEVFRRAKVHLKHLSPGDVRAAVESGRPITAEIDMTDNRGGPLCASIRADHPNIRWHG